MADEANLTDKQLVATQKALALWREKQLINLTHGTIALMAEAMADGIELDDVPPDKWVTAPQALRALANIIRQTGGK